MTEPALPRGGADGAPCRSCATPLAADQRYCLACGARRGKDGPIDFGELLGERAPAGLAEASPSRGRVASLAAGWRAAGSRTAGWRAGGLRAPAPVFATMLLALLGAGIGLGSLSSPRSLASDAIPPVNVSLPAPAVTAPPALTPPAVAPPAVTPPPAPVEPATTEPATTDSTPQTATTEPSTTDTSPPPPPPASTDDSTTTTGSDTEPATTPEKSPIEHVFVIRLGDAGVPYPFADSQSTPYLKTLVAKGTLLRDLRTVAGSGIADAIALLSGQAPNPQTLAGCPAYADLTPGTVAKDGQEEGEGCVYSAQTSTLTNQLDAQSLAWRAYVEDQAGGGPGVATSCRHPAAGAPDPRPGDAYSTVRNPFVYFHAITDAPACETAVTDLTALDADLAKAADKVPAFSYVVPGACHDGRVAPCVAGAPAGPGTADAFLAAILPKLMASKAWPTSLAIVSFDRAFAAPPATPAAEGGKVGALLLSPYARAGRVLGGRYDTYSLLAMIESIFGLDPLVNATKPAKRLGSGVFEDAPAT